MGLEAKNVGDLILARKKYKQALKIRCSILLPHDPLVGFNLNELLNVCISLASSTGEEEIWKEALLYCNGTLAAFQWMYPAEWPMLGLQYLIHGKLSFYLGYTEIALVSLQKAVPILNVSHGASHPLVHTLNGLLSEATAERNYELASLRP